MFACAAHSFYTPISGFTKSRWTS